MNKMTKTELLKLLVGRMETAVLFIAVSAVNLIFSHVHYYHSY